jgi:hypothetical protein
MGLVETVPVDEEVFDEPTPPEPEPVSWTDFGVKLPRDPARRELLEDALNHSLNQMTPAARERYIGALRAPSEYNFRVATASTKSQIKEMGKVTAYRTDTTDIRKMTLHLSRPSPEWEDWVERSNAAYQRLDVETYDRATGRHNGFRERLEEWVSENPEPEMFRLATVEELSGTLTHELTHILDFQEIQTKGRQALAEKFQRDGLMEKIREAYYGGTQEDIRAGLVDIMTDGNDAFAYASTKSTEAVAEIGRMYQHGTTGDIAYGARHHRVMTAEEWRSEFPELAKWAVDNLGVG